MLEALELPQSSISYDPDFLSSEGADHYLQCLKRECKWNQDKIKLFGKMLLQPRLSAWYGEADYSYSGLTMLAQPWSATLMELKMLAEMSTGAAYNSVLLNLYRGGQDSMGWHSDDEKELGPEPSIASISLGEPRVFHFRHRKDKNLKHKILLEHGSLLFMSGSTQTYWHHQLPKTRKNIGERINLTFRFIYRAI